MTCVRLVISFIYRAHVSLTVYSEWGFIRYFRLVVIPQLLFLAVWFIAAWGLKVAFGTVPLGWELARPAIIG